MSFFEDIKMYQSWQRTRKLLLTAKSIASKNSFNESQVQTLKDFDDYLEYNELGLAFDQLIYLTETIDLPKEFWKEMLLAANEMKLEVEAQKCKEHLNNE